MYYISIYSFQQSNQVTYMSHKIHSSPTLTVKVGQVFMISSHQLDKCCENTTHISTSFFNNPHCRCM